MRRFGAVVMNGVRTHPVRCSVGGECVPERWTKQSPAGRGAHEWTTWIVLFGEVARLPTLCTEQVFHFARLLLFCVLYPAPTRARTWGSDALCFVRSVPMGHDEVRRVLRHDMSRRPLSVESLFLAGAPEDTIWKKIDHVCRQRGFP